MRMRWVAVLSTAAAFLAVAPQAAWSVPSPAAEAYYQVYDRARDLGTLLPTFSMDEVRNQPQQLQGKLVEVRGMINAIAGSDAHITIMVEGAPGGASPMVALPTDKRLTDFPILDVSTQVRMLCRVVPSQDNSGGNLELVTAVKEYEAAQLDAPRAKAAAQRQALAQRTQKPAVRTQLGSRGVGSQAYNSRVIHRGGSSRPRIGNEEIVAAYAAAVQHFNRRVTARDADAIARKILYYSVNAGLDARLVMAVIAVESNFNSNAVSPVGAVGLGQLMPGTAADLGVGNSYDPNENLRGSTTLLSGHIRNFTSSGQPTEEAIKLALACYNAGPGAVKKYKGIPPYRETQNYVRKIMHLYKQMSRGDQQG